MQVFVVLKPNIICTFLIHYGGVQKMLTALTLFGIHRRINGQFFFECPGKMFLGIEKVLRKISEDQP